MSNPPNPWQRYRSEELGPPPTIAPEVYLDDARSILSENHSPDLPFTWSLNPYRGCLHACAYCYARPTHEYWGFGAGTDFDSKIIVKPDAPRLLREAFERPSWKGQLIVFSGNTDCYQPFEASYQLTRACLEVCLEYRQPVSIITKGALIERDIDLLAALTAEAFAQVRVSLCAMDPSWIRALEPMAPSPQRRLKTIAALSAAGISVGVMAAPIIPGLTEAEAPKVFKAAREAGAGFAEWALLRLPGSAAAVFAERLEAHFPGKAARVLRALDRARGGVIEGRPGNRFKGEGARWEAASKLLRLSARRLGYQQAPAAPEVSPFRRPGEGKQLLLFD